MRIVVYDGAADRYITLHFDPLCLVPLCCIVCAWNDERTLYNLNGDLCLDELDVSWREGYFELEILEWILYRGIGEFCK